MVFRLALQPKTDAQPFIHGPGGVGILLRASAGIAKNDLQMDDAAAQLGRVIGPIEHRIAPPDKTNIAAENLLASIGLAQQGQGFGGVFPFDLTPDVVEGAAGHRASNFYTPGAGNKSQPQDEDSQQKKDLSVNRPFHDTPDPSARDHVWMRSAGDGQGIAGTLGHGVGNRASATV